MDKTSGYMDNALRQNFFRAGHAHAGVIVILSLLCQVLADAAALPASLLWIARIAVPLAAILIPAGFFYPCCRRLLRSLAPQWDSSTREPWFSRREYGCSESG